MHHSVGAWGIAHTIFVMAINSLRGSVSTQTTAVNTLTPKSIASLKGAEEYFKGARKDAQARITEIDKLLIQLENEREQLSNLLDKTRF